ncbi:hypothetical protein [Streptomyces griseofuscus]|uniref:hypothetical protein n=1 Tax=Streptomyces griseofuscus TaxID=146922 RepID=UPI0036827F9A
MVISHLHAVAEAVGDVLLVERTPAGSSPQGSGSTANVPDSMSTGSWIPFPYF